MTTSTHVELRRFLPALRLTSFRGLYKNDSDVQATAVHSDGNAENSRHAVAQDEPSTSYRDSYRNRL